MKKYFIYFLFFIASTFLGIEQANAQCPANIGFELGNTNGWQSFISGYSQVAGNGCCPIVANVGPFPNTQFWTTKPIDNSRVRVVGAGVPGWAVAGPNDPYSGLPRVCPGSGNNYSLKLGNDSTGSQSERIRVQFAVTNSNSTLIYRYAAVMNDGAHDSLTQPRLDFKVFDAGLIGNLNPTAVLIPCASFIRSTPQLSGALPIGWFPGSGNTACSNWIPVAVNLNSYVGHIIQIEFATGDCEFGGHFGYAYVDVPSGCRPFTILTGYCSGQDTATMSAPTGFGSYKWYNKAASPPQYLGVGNNIKISVPNLIGTGPYPISCVVTPATGTGCNDTLVDTLRVLPDPQAGFTYNQNVCAGSPVQFIDTSKTNVAGSYIVHWEWDYNGDGITDDTVQNPIHTFPATGSYSIRLIVKSDLSCVSDTAWSTIVSVSLPFVAPNPGNDVSICQGANVQLNGSTYAGFSYLWYTLDGNTAPLNGLSNDTISNPIATPIKTTVYYYQITNIANGCVFTDSVKITVNGVSPSVYIKAVNDTICPNANTVLSIDNNSFSCNLTSRYCAGTTDHSIGSGSSNITVYPSPFLGSAPDAKIQMLFLKSELVNVGVGLKAGQIKGITFNVTSKLSTAPYKNLTVKLGCTNSNVYTSGGNYFATAGPVVSLPSYSTVAGLNNIPFQTAYNWDGNSNLVVEICFDNVFSTGNDAVSQTATTTNLTRYATSFGSGVDGCTLTFGSLSFNRPNITFTQCIPDYSTATYAWSPAAEITGSTTIAAPTAHPSNTTTYTCVITDTAGCSSTVTKEIVVDTTTHIVLGKDTTICNGQIFVANNSVGGVAPYSWQWTSTPSSGTTTLATPSFSPTVTTTYYVNFHGYHNCLVKDTIKVTVNPIPTSTFSFPNPVCSGTNVPVTYTGNAPSSATFSWNFGAGAVPSTITGIGPHNVTWTTAGTKTISLQVTNNGCTSTITTAQIVVNLSPTATFTVNPTTICTGANNKATITYTGNAYPTSLYNWNFAGGTAVSGSGSGPYQVYWTNGGNINVNLTVTESGCSATQSVPVTVYETPVSSFIVSPTAACSGDNITVTYTGNMPCPNPATIPFTWNFGPAASAPGNPSCGPQTITFANGGVYNLSLSITNNICVSTTTIIPVTITQTPSSSFSVSQQFVCSGSPINIFYNGTAGPSAGYNWTTTGNINPVHLNGSGPFNSVSWTENGNNVVNESITLKVTENGCTSPANTILVAVTPMPSADFSISSPVCAGANATATFIGSNNISTATFNWSFNFGIPGNATGLGPQQVSWPTPGSYNTSLVISQNGCISPAFNVPVVVLDNPIVSIHGDSLICPNASTSLWVQGANSYVWSPVVSNMPGLTVTPTSSPSTYSVVGTDNSGCTGTDSYIVTWRIPPYVNAGSDSIINRGNNVHIGDKLNNSLYYYNWSSLPQAPINKADTFYTQASPTATTLFILNVRDTFGCVNADSVLVTVQGCTQIEAPNAFNPASTHVVNQTFRAANVKSLLSLTRFEIYNRWGVKVFSTTDKNASWDGKYNGIEQESGTFTYYIEGICEDGFSVHKEGNVTLIR